MVSSVDRMVNQNATYPTRRREGLCWLYYRIMGNRQALNFEEVLIPSHEADFKGKSRGAVMPIFVNRLIVGMAFCLLSHSANAQIAGMGLPEGDGKEGVEAACVMCHGIGKITSSSGYTKEGWAALSSTMIDLSHDPELHNKIMGYLAKHYPPNTSRAAKLLAGDAHVEFKEWQVPTLGQRPRDPVESADGSIWWVGQWGNIMGQLNPLTGVMQEYALPENAKPHSVTIDKAGNAWYTGNKNGTIGKLDPSSGEITVFKMPDPAARDPHTAVFDSNGVLWFTLQHSNMIGRLKPETGDIKLVTMRTQGSKPYGIKVDAEGALWVACNGSNCLVRVDPLTMEIEEFKLPIPQTTVRRLDIDSKGMIWYVNSSQGRLGRLNPQTGKVKEWPSPSGPKSHPYALAVIDDIVWYNESGVRPDPLVRFDPTTEKFQSWAIPSGKIYAGIARHIRPTRDGDLLIHQTSTNRIIRVKLQSSSRNN